jgi:hypothetical protein
VVPRQRAGLAAAALLLGACIDFPVLPPEGESQPPQSSTPGVAADPGQPLPAAPTPRPTDSPPQAPAAPPQPSPPGTAAPGGNVPEVTCSAGVASTSGPVAGGKLHCTIIVNNDVATVGFEEIVGNDPTTTTTKGICTAELGLGAETIDVASGAGRPVGQASLGALVAILQRFKQTCSQARGQLVGAVATGWARQASNRREVQDRLRAETNLQLSVPSEAEELAQRYLGVSRNRIGLIVLDDRARGLELLVWPRQADAPTRHPVPVTFAQAGNMYLGALFTSFDDARLALRSRLKDELRVALAEIAGLIRRDRLAPVIVVGPNASATIPLAIKGELRDPELGWPDPEAYRMKLDQARIFPSPDGRVYGVVSPAEIDLFFLTVDLPGFMQLRSQPIRRAYGERLMLETTLLDLLVGELEASAFHFTFTNSYYGYLLQTLFPDRSGG